ncbi:RHS repeat-associated core domain-containing protein, partial [Streptomyces sp. TR06-5]|uniref:RHS repeat-associated core domain-containing protein n=1 Tax=Streptomyces sp. TR06-5 TaxID=3385976 RepID=UPI0039A15F52
IDAQTLDMAQRRTLPFGSIRGDKPDSWPSTKGFIGGTDDTATGLTHLGAREYDPTTGRFLSVDLIMDAGDPQQIHGYAYAHNNPLTFSDSTGAWDWLDNLVDTASDVVSGAWNGMVDFYYDFAEGLYSITDGLGWTDGARHKVKGDRSGDSWYGVYDHVQAERSDTGAYKLGYKLGYTFAPILPGAGMAANASTKALNLWLKGGTKAATKTPKIIATLPRFTARQGAVDTLDGAIPAGSPVTHGPTFTRIGDDVRSIRNSQNVANAGHHDVVAHGTPDGYLDLDEGLVNGGQIVDAVRNNPAYRGGCLRLLVCYSGRDTSGIAQQVANEMGVTVLAPTDMVGTAPALGAGQEPRIANGGYWRKFLPIVRRR